MNPDTQQNQGFGDRASHVMSLWLLAQHGFAPKTVIDVGAAEGAFFVACTEARLFPSARFFFVDAMHENEPTYRSIAAKFGGGYEITALSCLEGEVALRVDPDFYNTHIDHLQPTAPYEGTRRVPVQMLDALVQRHALQPPFVLKIDVQGGELDVLRGGLRTLEDCIAVCTEIQLFSPRDTLVELLMFMQSAGWALYDITDPAYYHTDNSMYQCYAVFIPRSMDFRTYGAWCTPKQEEAALADLRERRAHFTSRVQQILKQR